MDSSSSSSSSEQDQIHVVMIPLMSPGHLIPMVDMAKLLVRHGVAVTVVTTPLNALKVSATVNRCADSGLPISILELPFPAAAAGLPEGCENMSMLPSRHLIPNFFVAAAMLRQPLEDAFPSLLPRPSCIVSGKNLPWTADIARKFSIPRLFFDGMGCFSFCCSHNIEVSRIQYTVSGSDPFVIPGLPHRIELTRLQLPESLNPSSPDLEDVRSKIRAVEETADGILVNSFEELESVYVDEFKKAKGNDNVWCIGPVSASNKLSSDKAERGGSLDETRYCLDWLETREPGSVVYACLGSICGLAAHQLVELALGLEESNRPFIWVTRGDEKSSELEKWISEQGFEERIKGRGILIRGWAPQVLILAHKAIGGFLTHCGWNSTTEGICAGVPIITCPLFAEQFFNEKLIVDVLGIGASVGVKSAVIWGQEEKFGLVMKREGVKKAIEEVMDKSKEGEDRRKRARELGEIARGAIEEGGSSYLNVKLMCNVIRKMNQSH